MTSLAHWGEKAKAAASIEALRPSSRNDRVSPVDETTMRFPDRGHWSLRVSLPSSPSPSAVLWGTQEEPVPALAICDMDSQYFLCHGLWKELNNGVSFLLPGLSLLNHAPHLKSCSPLPVLPRAGHCSHFLSIYCLYLAEAFRMRTGHQRIWANTSCAQGVWGKTGVCFL